ncbi:MAG: glutathione S-transferase N-terminal domain-containing protein [Burkholderiales bacterium]|nr:glutathione S-transferase N-terminal domain-containing protein [Burkholderiales bacterium]
MLDLYTWDTPNGQKGRIAVEESGLACKLHAVNLQAGANVTAEYLAISSSRRIPALVDSDGPGGRPVTLIESGVIMVYLAKKTGSPFYPSDYREQLEVDQWLLHGQSTFGPGVSPLAHLENRIQGDHAAAKAFFRGRAERLYETLDLRLAGRAWLALERYTVADISHLPWVNRAADQRIDLARYPNVKRWLDAGLARPAVQRGLAPVAG